MSTLHIGVSRRTISPPLGIYLMGYGNRTQGNIGIHDDLYVTTMVLDDGEHRAALLTVDHTFIHPVVVDQVKKRLPSIPPDAVFVCCSHSHAGPIGFADVQSRAEDKAYIAFLVDQLVASVVEAQAGLQPASLWAGRSEAHININRRERLPDGKIIIGNNPDGPVDHSVQVMQVRSNHNAVLATLVNYACHPVVMGPQNRMASADWVGAMRRQVESQGDGLCLFVQGATADLNPRLMHWEAVDWAEVEQQGMVVAEAVRQACANLQMLATGPIAADQDLVWLPVLPPTGYNDAMHAFLPGAKSEEEIRAALYAAFPWQVTVEDREGMLYSPVSIGALQVGTWTLLALGTEPFTETGLALKAGSPAAMTFIAGYTNGCNSYLPVRSAYADGGYEVETAPLFYGLPSGFAPGGAEAALKAIQVLYADLG